MPTKFNAASGEYEEVTGKEDKLAVEMSRATVTLIKGDKGDKGEKGETGDKGDKGDKGDTGKDGMPGKDGATGKDGINGNDGKDGLDGISLPGKPGKDGREIELTTENNVIKWRYKGEAWQPLATLPMSFASSGGGRMRLIDLQKKLTAGDNITITNDGDHLVIASTAIGSGSAHTIQDEGTPLTARTNLNFVGTGVAVTDDAGNDATIVTINTGGSGSIPQSSFVMIS